MRVAAYARVSTDRDDQNNSFESQVNYFESYIESRADWILTKVYADEGVTGTSTKERLGFKSMIEDAMAGEFDLIITKEVSRFARNTLDSIAYTRKLKERDVFVCFMLDGIDTSQPDAELRLTLMAALAQEESRKTSERVKWGQKRRMEAGVVFGRDMLGYKVKNGRLEIEPAGAEVVRLIFRKYVNEGKGAWVIAKELEQEGISPANPGRRGGAGWSPSVILKILKNEKYVGDLCQKKTWTKNYLDHKKRSNRNDEEMVYIKNHHEEIAIVGRELWEAAQEEIKKRAAKREDGEKHSAAYWCSGRIFCGECGGRYTPKSKRLAYGGERIYFRCFNRAVKGKDCGSGYINIKCLEQILWNIITLILNDRENVLREIIMDMAEFKACQGFGEMRNYIKAAEEKRKRLISLFIDGKISNDEFKAEEEKAEREKALLEKCLWSGKGRAESLEERRAEILAVAREVIFSEKGCKNIFSSVVERIEVYRGCIAVKLKGIGCAVEAEYEVRGRGDKYRAEIKAVRKMR